MDKQYVEQRNENYWITDSRVSLESVVFAFLEGLSPETIVAECFSVLSLEQVYGAITYYLSNRPKIDEYLRHMDSEFIAFQKSTHDAEFSRRMTKARRELQLSSS